jgi:hypothetical protein
LGMLLVVLMASRWQEFGLSANDLYMIVCIIHACAFALLYISHLSEDYANQSDIDLRPNGLTKPRNEAATACTHIFVVWSHIAISSQVRVITCFRHCFGFVGCIKGSI